MPDNSSLLKILIVKSLLVLLIFPLILTSCSSRQLNGSSNVKIRAKEKKPIEKKEKISKSEDNFQNTPDNSSSEALNTVNKYLTLLSNGQTNQANKLLISKKYTFDTKEGNKLNINPNTNNPFSYIKVKKIDNIKASLSSTQITVYAFTVTADIKWPSDSKVYDDTVFFINALTEDRQWKVDGISTEF